MTAGLPRLRSTPLVQQARETLIDAILNNRFPDDRLPTEPELARQLGVSRTTVRGALNELHALGLIDRTRGAGTVVLSHTGAKVLGLSGLISFSRLLGVRGHIVTSEGELTIDAAPARDVVERLQLDGAEGIHLFRVVLFADKEPALVSRARFRVRELARQPDPDALPSSVLDLSAACFRDPIDHAVAEILPTAAGEDMFEGLDVVEGEPLLMLRETHYTSSHRPVAISDVLIDPRQQLLSVFRRVPHTDEPDEQEYEP